MADETKELNAEFDELIKSAPLPDDGRVETKMEGGDVSGKESKEVEERQEEKRDVLDKSATEVKEIKPDTEKELEYSAREQKLLADLAEARKKVELYEPLLRDKIEGKTVDIKQEGTVQAKSDGQVPKTWGEYLQVTQDDVLGFLSGDPDKARPVIHKFANSIIYLANAAIQQRQLEEQKYITYAAQTKSIFDQKYPEAAKYPKIVKAIGDEIELNYRQRGVNKYPHEMIDEIGEAVTTYIREIKGVQENKTRRQGEPPIIRPVKKDEPKLSEQQEEMFDLLKQE